MTPHIQFKEINLRELNIHIHAPATIVDTRGFWPPEECKSAGFDYIWIGRPLKN
ncbi:MAG: hypothetical protein ABSD41_07215 [Candidatus Bathyarchaeia archaeon]